MECGIDTPLLAGTDAVREPLIALHPAGRLDTPEEVAELTVLLLSDRAAEQCNLPGR
jgi:hypothetical protein